MRLDRVQKTRTSETIAGYNKKMILDALRFQGNMSRADLSRHLDMSFPAISSNARGLLEANYIIEVGAGDNSLGRKSTILAFNAKRGYIVGIDLGRFRIRIMLADLLGNEVTSRETANCANLSGDGKQSIGLIRDQIQAILEQTGKTKDDLLCIVIGTPGIIKDGRSFLAPFAENYLEQDMIETLQEAFEADVLLENCVNLGVVGEQWKGAGVNYKDILYIAYGVGLGSALVLDGNLYKGANGAAGEMGFMITDPSNIDKEYEEIGSLEEALSRGKIKHYLESGKFDEEIVKLVARYQNEGNTYAKRVIDEIALHFGIALVNMCALLNPEVLIIAGGLGVNLGKLFLAQWKETLGKHVPFAPDVCLSRLNHKETMLGAIKLGITHIHGYQI